jgi:PAS domain S-box-containing protein
MPRTTLNWPASRAAQTTVPQGVPFMPERLVRSRTGPRVGHLVAGLVLVSMGPLALLTWFSVSLSTQAVRSQAEARVRDTASASGVYVGQQLDSLAELVSSYAQRPTLVAALHQPASQRDRRLVGLHLSQLRQARPGIAVAFVADPRGRLIGIVPATPSIVGQDFSYRDWYRGVTATGRPYVSEAYETAATGHARVVAAAVQVRAPGSGGRPGRVLGVLVAAYDLDTIQQFVDQFSAAQGVQLTVTDQRGVLVASPGAGARGLVSRRQDPLVAGALGGRAGVTERTSRGARVVSAYQPVPGIGWTVTADVATDTAFGPVHRLRRTVLAIGAVLGLILLAGLGLLVRSLRERARAEQRLRDSEERTRAILEAANEAFVSMDASGMISAWNRQAAQTFGWSAAEAVGRNLAQTIIPGRLRDAHEQGRQRYLATGEGPVLHQRLELTAVHRDGHEFPIELVIWPVGTGDQTSFNAFAHDISERRQAEATAHATQERLRLALEAARMGFWDWDIPSGQTVWSPQLERLFALSPGSLDGAEAFRQRLHPDDRETVVRWTAAAAEGAAPGEIQFRVVWPDGQLRWMEGQAQLYRNSTGHPVRMVAVVVDVTERMRVLDALRQAKQEADRANSAKSEFLSRMSHELRTPLNAILGFAQLLELDDLEEGQREGLGHISKAGRHLLALINEVLDIAAIEAGRLGLSLEPVPVGPLLREAMELVRSLADRRAIQLIDRTGVRGSTHVAADAQRLKQVLINLLSNAIKYNRDGGEVLVDCEQLSQERLRIKVTDTGPGIAPELLDRLFVPFERLGAERGTIEGSGIGLALSRRLTEAMGGTLQVATVVGEGSSFWVELPLAEAPVGRLDDLQPPDPAADEQTELGPACTILYVEDNLSNLELVQRILGRRPSVRLLTAMQGRLGLQFAREHRPDLILLDLHLPDLSGDTVLQQLQSDPQTSGIPVVMVSADATPGQVQRLLAAGAREYLTKPLDVTRFLRVVDEIVVGARR